jgi:plastocyanin domain-containing protein
MLPRTTRDGGDEEGAWRRQVRVRVAGGDVPSTIRAEGGRPLRLIFCREESSACSEQLVLPAFGKSVTLPRGEAVAVDLPAMGPGEYEFIDGMGMLRGRLLVTLSALGARAHPSCPQEEWAEPRTPHFLSSTPLGEARTKSGVSWHTDTP